MTIPSYRWNKLLQVVTKAGLNVLNFIIIIIFFLKENYVQRLATAMEDLFHNKHGVHPSLVSDVYNFIYKRTGIIQVY